MIMRSELESRVAAIKGKIVTLKAEKTTLQEQVKAAAVNEQIIDILTGEVAADIMIHSTPAAPDTKE